MAVVPSSPWCKGGRPSQGLLRAFFRGTRPVLSPRQFLPSGVHVQIGFKLSENAQHIEEDFTCCRARVHGLFCCPERYALLIQGIYNILQVLNAAARRSTRVIINVSPGRRNSINSCNSLLPVRLLPLAFSARMISQPAARRICVCRVRSWSLVETRA